MSFKRRRFALAIGLVLAGSAPASAQLLKSTVWWNASEPGWGLYIADQGNVLVPYWFTHDFDGEPAWFLALTTPQADGSYRGGFERITGVPLAQIQNQAADGGEPLGDAELLFDEQGGLTFTYSVDGVTQSKQLQRFAFGDKDVYCRATGETRNFADNYSDLWWNPLSSGWGVHISHVGSDLYFTWYTYDTDGEPIYYQGVTTRRLDESYAGELYRSKDGTPFLQIDGAPANDGAEVVGSTRLIFADGANATFEYSIGSISQRRQIQRYQFGNLAGVCSVEEYGSVPGGDGGGSGDTIDCLPGYSLGDSREVLIDEGMPSEAVRTERVSARATFEGEEVLVEEFSGDTVAGFATYARNFVQSSASAVVFLGGETVDPVTGTTVARRVNDPLRVQRPRAFRLGQSHELTWTEFTTARGRTTSEELHETITLEAVEEIEVQAGTFTACRFAVLGGAESSQDAGSFDIVSTTERRGLRWTHPQFGLLKEEISGKVEVTSPAFSESRELNSTQELLFSDFRKDQGR